MKLAARTRGWGVFLVFTPDLHGLELEVPDGANNLMDPFRLRTGGMIV